MKYALVKTPDRDTFVALEPAGWGRPFEELHKQTYVCGYDEWLAYSYNNFNNQFQQADEQRYKEKGLFAILFRDVARRDGVETSEGRIPVIYISHSGISGLEKVHRGLAPANGYIVPSEDDIFVKDNGLWIQFYNDTLIPRKTEKNQAVAKRMLEARGIPKEQLTLFCGPPNSDDWFVVRVFDPDWVDGRFYVYAYGLPSSPGSARVASRHVSEDGKIAFEVDARHLY